jgi:hypothetical protein
MVICIAAAGRVDPDAVDAKMKYRNAVLVPRGGIELSAMLLN